IGATLRHLRFQAQTDGGSLLCCLPTAQLTEIIEPTYMELPRAVKVSRFTAATRDQLKSVRNHEITESTDSEFARPANRESIRSTATLKVEFAMASARATRQKPTT